MLCWTKALVKNKIFCTFILQLIKNKGDDYLSHAAFLLHVLSDNRPDLAFAQQSPTSGNFEALVGPILLQDSMDDPNRLSHTHTNKISGKTSSLLSSTSSTAPELPGVPKHSWRNPWERIQTTAKCQEPARWDIFVLPNRRVRLGHLENRQVPGQIDTWHCQHILSVFYCFRNPHKCLFWESGKAEPKQPYGMQHAASRC